jgi:N-acetylmuramoyl-L-alanine amidase
VEITASSLNVRSRAMGTVLGSVDRGDAFVVQEQRNGWYRVHWQGRSAWLSSSYTRRLPTRTAVYVETGALNVRSGASSNYGRLGMVADGQAYVLLARSGNWQKIQYDRRSGWVHSAYTRTQSVGSGSSTTTSTTTTSSSQYSSGNTPTRHAPMTASASELEVLARICKGEASVTAYEGKVAVCAVVLNRVRSNRHPNTITRVAHQPWQFSCYNPDVRNRLYWGAIPQSCWDAAREALSGVDPTHGSTFYFNPFLVRPSWAKSLEFVRRIGSTRRDAHDFYRRR